MSQGPGTRGLGSGVRERLAVFIDPLAPGPWPLVPRCRQRGSALVLAMVLVFVLVMVALAFIITARTESRAATNALRGQQAEASCRMGLAAAVYRIERTCALYSDLSDTGGWHGAFYDAAGPDLCPASWVEHYDAAQAGGLMTAKRWPMPLVAAGDPSPPEVKALKRQRGFTADYFVAVADLDGKLRVNPKDWDTLISADADKLKTMSRVWLDSAEPFKSDAARADTVAGNIAACGTTLRALGEMRAALALADGDETAAVESFLTVHPRSLPASRRPPVNVNTAHHATLKAIVRNVPGFDDPVDDSKTVAVAAKLCAKRPFPDRKAMEAALAELGRPAWNPAGVDDVIQSEAQMNDLLNSLAGDNSAPVDASDYDDAGMPGYYHYDFDKDGDTSERTSDQASATWGTEVKFASQFYHVYVLGRTTAADDPERVMSQRRLHAVYDAGAHRVLWLRWNFEARANMGD